MKDWTDIREPVLAGKVSQRAILRETGMHWLIFLQTLADADLLQIADGPAQ